LRKNKKENLIKKDPYLEKFLQHVVEKLNKKIDD